MDMERTKMYYRLTDGDWKKIAGFSASSREEAVEKALPIMGDFFKKDTQQAFVEGETHFCEFISLVNWVYRLTEVG